jgi:F0F1-type ATP synthase gamma subunit
VESVTNVVLQSGSVCETKIHQNSKNGKNHQYDKNGKNLRTDLSLVIGSMRGLLVGFTQNPIKTGKTIIKTYYATDQSLVWGKHKNGENQL